MPEVRATVPGADPLAGQNYRIRRLAIKMDVDVYDADGFLTSRAVSDDIIIAEANFPPVLVDLLMNATNMRRGFVKRAAVEPAPPLLHAVPPDAG